MSGPQSEYVIFPKTHDLIKWLMEHTAAFPRNQRFLLAKRVQDAALDFYECLIAARKVTGRQRAEMLLRADVALETLRLHLRLCYELKLSSADQYKHVSQLVTEVGKLLGRWIQGPKSQSGGSGL